ncbi:S41 family peptidase [Amycolatopsis sp. WAC 01376]|uniref:S41 family peptidase n=1 Tax=Amycolatopsis sp. WAC 01376 TaxID=2203195 RepID=UPI00131599E9|nr:S41 family peptidase [Amycolatopsis sp. WAC 01376]
MIGANEACSGHPSSASGYLEQALDLLEQRALDRGRVDWPKVRTKAHAMAHGARTPAQTYPAINRAIAALGNSHTALIPAGAVPAPSVARIAVPQGRLIEGRYALLTIPAFQSDEAGTVRYVAAGRDAVRGLDTAAPCGWLIDLQGNTGGDMWPMLTVLGDGRIGAFTAPGQDALPWEARGADILLSGRVLGTNPDRLNRTSPPVAVLTDSSTAGSGEAVAIAFRGLDRARGFGEDTMGFSTSNETLVLADGAYLLITTAVMADRGGQIYGHKVTPDSRVSSGAGGTIAAATEWLSRRPGCD